MSFPRWLAIAVRLTDHRGMIRYALLLPLMLAACPKDETISGYTDPDAVLALAELDGAPFSARATIAFPEEGVVRGTGPCNGYSADQTVPYPWFQLGPIRATRSACPDLDHETAFFDALQDMTLIEALGDTVILRNEAGREMVFRVPQP